ncbi:hypothetical protein ACHHYP_20512 [Achlya hypogyna]|uniref:DDE-1 domain-containing protein n=1 Tax=Achlya hypogyna TaxID=1202772 RepID=A0A1V9YK43_ACHHY|nr:hypothetical protein ACHHYP_20512 [Achlya hypogyna]
MEFWSCFADVPSDSIVNADETGIYYDYPPNDSSYDYMWTNVESEIVALPPNCTSVAQPLDVGVMGVFKAKLRRLWIEDATVHITAAQKRRATIQRAIQAWDEISRSIIKSSFEKAIPRK